MLKKTYIIVGLVLAVVQMPTYARMKIYIVNNSSYTVEVPSSNCGATLAEQNGGCYWGKQGFGPENKWEVAPSLNTPISKDSNHPTDIELAHSSFGINALVSEIQLNAFNDQGIKVGTCYLINTTDNNDYPQGIVNSIIGQYTVKDSKDTFYPNMAPVPGTNQCNLLWATISGETGGDPKIYVTLYDNNAFATVKEIDHAPQVTAVLLAADYMGEKKSLYRVDFFGQTVSTPDVQKEDASTMALLNPYALNDSASGLDYALPPSKILRGVNSGTLNGVSREGNVYFTNHASVYLYGPLSGTTLSVTSHFQEVSLSSDIIALPNTYPAGSDLSLTSSFFSIELQPLLPTGTDEHNKPATAVIGNGMDQAPLQVKIYYEPTDQTCSPESACIISSHYHAELMYLYQRVFFENNGTLISNLESKSSAGNPSASNYTVVTNYPGPYVAVPNTSGSLVGAYPAVNYDEGSVQNFAYVPPSHIYNNSSIYYVSTTNSSVQNNNLSISAHLLLPGMDTEVRPGEQDTVWVTVQRPETCLDHPSPWLVTGVANQFDLEDCNNTMLPMYDGNQYSQQYSSATTFDLSHNVIIGLPGYFFGHNVINAEGSRILINADGMGSLPYITTKLNGVPVVDIFGNLVISSFDL